MSALFYQYIQRTLQQIVDDGLFKSERVIASPQEATITLHDGQQVLNFCSNNYLGLANHPQLIAAAKKGMDTHGFGLSSVRFICGTTDLHKLLEEKIAAFFGTEDSILYAACFDANGGVFEPLLSAEDAIISDTLNHASIIDGVRLSKAKRYRYKTADMADLEQQLKAAQEQRYRLIVTDGVFSMDGHIAPMNQIVFLAKKYDALVMVEECHSAGVVGETGRGVTEHFNLRGEIDIITGTLGKAFGGAIGGFTTGKKEVVALLRQRSRPYLFSNTLPPAIAAAGIAFFDLMKQSSELCARLHQNTLLFREKMSGAGFILKPSESAICAVMLYDAALAQQFARLLLEKGVYAVGFSYPVVPKEEARIRVQLSAAHTKSQIKQAVDAFISVGRQLGVV
jgi:glycine C-acetyltransferase